MQSKSKSASKNAKQRKFKPVFTKRAQTALPASSRVSQYRRKNNNDFLDDIMEAASYIPVPYLREGLDLARKARHSDVGKRLENEARRFVGERVSHVKDIEKKIEKAVESKEIKEVVRPTRRIHNIASVPRARGSAFSPVIEGCEPMKAIVAPAAGWKAGDLMFSTLIDPINLKLPKLARMAKGYELYHLGGSFKLKGGAGTDTPGTYIMFIDYDPSDRSDLGPNGEQNVTIALAHVGAVTGNAFEECTCHIRAQNEPQRLYVDNDQSMERFTSVGRLSLVCMSPIPANTNLGELFLAWKVKLSQPQEDPGVPVGDFWRCDYSATMGGTNPMLASGTVWPTSSIEADRSQESVGALRFPPGSFWVSYLMGTGTNLAVASGTWGVYPESPAVYNPAHSSQSISQYICMVNHWVSSTVPWRMLTNLTGTWQSCRVMVCATTASPYGSTFAIASNVLNRAASALKQSANLDKVIADVHDAQAQSVVTTKSAMFCDDYCVVGSTSSQSSRSAGTLRRS